jgi:3-oxosteroid 1-dehydrogenase
VTPVERYDVVVLGTAAAGLTAALRAAADGARVGLFEKADQVGGTTAWSGGVAWLPGNRHQREPGLEDSRDQVLTYLTALSHGLIDPALAAVFVDTAPEVVDWLEDSSPVVFETVRGLSDYHPEHPGGRREGRSVECPLFPFDELGAWAGRVARGYQLRGEIAMSETPLGRRAPDGVPREELRRRQERDERACGQALVGRLLKGLLDRGVEPRTGCRGERLLVEQGRIAGVLLTGPDGPFAARATGGVVLATGGFEHDAELVRAFLRGPLERPVSVPTNTGDGLRMAMRVGASLANMREAWWVAAIDVPASGGGVVAWQVNSERTRPGTVFVNRDGQRFTDEAANYNALGNALHVVDVARFDYVNSPAWMVFDHAYLTTYGLAGRTASEPTPDWIITSPTVAGLAERIAVPPTALEATLSRWNAHVAEGHDPDHRRGESHHDRAWGDTARFGETRRATLGPLDTAPFHAVQVRVGALGTKGGPRTDGDARVLDVDGVPMPGLYAAGNAMASVMGMTYGGHGGTLGPALVFGLRAGRDAAARALAGAAATSAPAPAG